MRFDRMRRILRLEFRHVKRYRLNRVRCIPMYPERWETYRGTAGRRGSGRRNLRDHHADSMTSRPGSRFCVCGMWRRCTIPSCSSTSIRSTESTPASRGTGTPPNANARTIGSARSAGCTRGTRKRRRSRRAPGHVAPSGERAQPRVQPRLPCSVGICSNRLESQSTKSLSLAGTCRFGGYSTEIGRAGVLKPVRTSRNSPDFR